MGYLAPQVGLEPTTLRLTAECSTIELLRSKAGKLASSSLHQAAQKLSMGQLVNWYFSWNWKKHTSPSASNRAGPSGGWKPVFFMPIRTLLAPHFHSWSRPRT